MLLTLNNRTAAVLNHVWSGDTFQKHISRLTKSGTNARDTDILSSAAMLNMNIYVYQKQGNVWQWCKYSPNQLLAFDDEHIQAVNGIYLVNTNENHFDVVNSIHTDTISDPISDNEQDSKHDDMNVESNRNVKLSKNQRHALKKYSIHMLRIKKKAE